MLDPSGGENYWMSFWAGFLNKFKRMPLGATNLHYIGKDRVWICSYKEVFTGENQTCGALPGFCLTCFGAKAE